MPVGNTEGLSTGHFFEDFNENSKKTQVLKILNVPKILKTQVGEYFEHFVSENVKIHVRLYVRFCVKF
jgi:hypothetical protein